MTNAQKLSDTFKTVNHVAVSPSTVKNYIDYFIDAFMISRARRYDVKGRQHLKSLEKYYIVDQSLRSLLLANKGTDIGHILENIVLDIKF